MLIRPGCLLGVEPNSVAVVPPLILLVPEELEPLPCTRGESLMYNSAQAPPSAHQAGTVEVTPQEVL